jgi:hypothetical protein
VEGDSGTATGGVTWFEGPGLTRAHLLRRPGTPYTYCGLWLHGELKPAKEAVLCKRCHALRFPERYEKPTKPPTVAYNELSTRTKAAVRLVRGITKMPCGDPDPRCYERHLDCLAREVERLLEGRTL